MAVPSTGWLACDWCRLPSSCLLRVRDSDLQVDRRKVSGPAATTCWLPRGGGKWLHPLLLVRQRPLRGVRTRSSGSSSSVSRLLRLRCRLGGLSRIWPRQPIDLARAALAGGPRISAVPRALLLPESKPRGLARRHVNAYAAVLKSIDFRELSLRAAISEYSVGEKEGTRQDQRLGRQSPADLIIK